MLYVEAVLGCDRRTARDRVRVVDRLQELPAVAEALRDGEMLWAAVREVVRVAVPETEDEWVAAASGRPGTVVQRMVSGLEPGDRPGAARKAHAEDAVLRLEVKASTKAMWLEARKKLQRETGGSLDDDELVQLVARAVLEGPKEEGRASYQVQLTVCAQCGDGRQQAGGEQVPVEPEAVAVALCDAQMVASLPVAPGVNDATESEMAPGATPAPASAVARGATPEPARGATPERDQPRRATQPVPKRIRELVIRRDSGRCAVPGCANHTWVDVHHVEPRSDGGTNDPDGLLTLCTAHHRAAHAGRLVIDGRAQAGFRFSYPDGSPYGAAPPRPAPVDLLSTVTQVLHGMGFKLREANQAAARIRDRVTPDTSVEDAIRAALQAI